MKTVSNSTQWLKNCCFQRNTDIISRIEKPTGNIHFLNIITKKIEILGKEVKNVWLSLDGTKTAIDVVHKLTMDQSQQTRLTEGKKYVNALEYLHRQKFIYIKQEAYPDFSSSDPSFFDIVPCNKPDVRYRRETPDIFYLFDTSRQKKNPSLLLPHYFGRVWELITQHLSIREIVETIYREFGQRASLKNIKEFILDLESQGLISLGTTGEYRNFVPADEKTFSVIDFHHRNWNWGHKYKIETFLRETHVPWYIVWEMTYACNYRCKHCYAANYGSDTIPLETQGVITREFILKRFLDAGITHMTLMGGEPFIVPEIIDIIKSLRENYVFVKIQTNGSLLTDELVTQLEEIGLNQIEISLDGTKEEINDSIRGTGSYKRTINALRLLRNSTIPKKGICYTVTRNNYYDLENLPAFVRQFDIDEVFVSKFFVKGRGEKYEKWALTADQRHELRRKLVHMNQNQDDLDPTERAVYFAIWNCAAAKTYCVVNPYGEIRPCTLHDRIIGSLADQSLVDLWQKSPDLAQMRYPYLVKESCKNCAKSMNCEGSFCSARVYKKEKSLIAKKCLDDYDLIPD
ncbi:MAG: radical SAM protein [Candidatus Odinarchaeota archaeon]